VVAASNIYLGLKTGFTFGASLFGALLGAAIIKALQQILPKKWGGGDFGPRENCTIQTSATAAGGLTGMVSFSFNLFTSFSRIVAHPYCVLDSLCSPLSSLPPSQPCINSVFWVDLQKRTLLVSSRLL